MTAYGHYFDEATKEIHSPKVPVDLEAKGLGYLLYHSIKQAAAKGLIAQIDAATGQRDSFESLLTRSIRLAISLKNMGVERGDMITICSYNQFNNIVPVLAGLYIGAIISTTDPTMSQDEQQHALNIVKPKLIFVSEGSENLIAKSIAPLEFKCELITYSEEKFNNYRNFSSFIQEHQDEHDFQPDTAENPEDTCLVLFSSGTTGLAKGICLSHYLVMNTFACALPIIAIKPRFLVYSSLYWIGGMCFPLLCLKFGLERVVCSHFDASLTWEYIDKYQVDCVFAVASQTIQTIKYLEQMRKPHSIKIYLSGGNAIAPHHYQRLRDLLPNTLVICAYGQTEVPCISIFLKKDDNYKKLASVGVLESNIIAKIVDPDTEEPLGLNKAGEILVKTPYAMNGYFNQDTSLCWASDGFLKTGDVGYFDDDLCLYVTDRLKEMFKYKAWHIVPAKLEAILQSHPAVDLAVVVGIPHPIEEHHAVGGVTLIPGATVSGDELESYVEERVSERNRLRAGVVILEHMPLTPSGKVMRRLVKEKLIKMIIL